MSLIKFNSDASKAETFCDLWETCGAVIDGIFVRKLEGLTPDYISNDEDDEDEVVIDTFIEEIDTMVIISNLELKESTCQADGKEWSIGGYYVVFYDVTLANIPA